jgi:hypothetical protein
MEADMSAPINRRKYDERRYADQPWRRWYSNAPWAKAKRRQLARQPLCEMCEGRGRTVPASIVHHRTPHRGDWAKFIDPANFASLCAACHDGAAQSAERMGYSDEVDPATGLPRDDATLFIENDRCAAASTFRQAVKMFRPLDRV